MKRKDIIDNIDGSRLKKQFLEAFLLQSVFIESLLKKLIEIDLYENVTFKILREQMRKGDFTTKSKHAEYIEEKLLRQNLFEIIEYLFRIDVISGSLKKDLHKYRELRNGVLHDLVGKMSKAEFEKELEGLVGTGQAILNEPVMIRASESVQDNEEFLDAVKSDDITKIQELMDRKLNIVR
ncbi:MAG: hypothetical protein K0S38_654 [Candidatus Paceibacter sp.]|jgi:hypothetical protein|nr:hypothetical protein [Candidatus Paceibacter sp.]